MEPGKFVVSWSGGAVSKVVDSSGAELAGGFALEPILVARLNEGNKEARKTVPLADIPHTLLEAIMLTAGSNIDQLKYGIVPLLEKKGYKVKLVEFNDYVQPNAALDAGDLDITDADAVARVIEARRPRVLINAASYTAVDKAESDALTAYAANSDGPRNLANACFNAGIPLIHISTDYVFDGGGTRPWTETDPVAPLSSYGRSKAAARKC